MSCFASDDAKTSQIYGRMTLVRRLEPEENKRMGGKYQSMPDKCFDDMRSRQLSCVTYYDTTAVRKSSGTNV
jgi:hypothetical protein